MQYRLASDTSRVSEIIMSDSLAIFKLCNYYDIPQELAMFST